MNNNIEIENFDNDNEPDGALAMAIATVNQEWPQTADAQVWARKWMEHVEVKPSIATDEGCMIGWFANAIMAGYDTACMQMAQRENTKDEQEELI